MSYSESEMSESITTFIQEQVLAGGVELKPDTSLADIGVDSFSLMEVILFIERKFGLVMPLEELTPETIRSVNTLAACCHRLLAAAQNR